MNTRWSHAALLLSLVLLTALSFGSAMAAGNIRLQRLSPDEGLSQGHVTSLLLDEHGQLWLGTQKGLNLYNGYVNKVLAGPDDAFANAQIKTVFMDHDRDIWVATRNAGLWLMEQDEGRFTLVLPPYPADNPGVLQEVTHISQGDPQTLVITLADKVLLYDKASRSHQVLFALAATPSSQSLCRAALLIDNWLYVATTDGLYQVERESRQWRPLPHTPTPAVGGQRNTKSLMVDDGQLLVGTVAGLYALPLAQTRDYFTNPGGGLAVRELVSELNVWTLARNGDSLYLGTNRGLYQLTDQGQLERLLALSQSSYLANDDTIRDLVIDHQGNLWLASRNEGAFYWVPRTTAFTTLSSNAGAAQALSDNRIGALLQTSASTLWIGTQRGLNRVSLDSLRVQRYPGDGVNPATSRISGIFAAGPRRLLLLTEAGLYRFETDSGRTQQARASDPQLQALLQQPLLSARQLTDGRLALVGRRHHLIYDPRTNEITPLPALDQLAPPLYSRFFLPPLPGRPETLLLATDGRLWSFDPRRNQGELIYQSNNYQPQTSAPVQSWQQDDQGILWLAIPGEGLVGLSQPDFTPRFHHHAGTLLPTNHIFDLLEDHNHNLWLASHAGLLRFDPRQHHVEQFTYQDGVSANEYNAGAAALLDDGRLAFGSVRGLTLFDPADVTRQAHLSDYTTHITAIELLSRPIDNRLQCYNNEQVVLAHDDFGLQVEYSTLEYEKQQRTLYQVEISGANNITYPPTRSNHITFSRLLPGEYQLTVRATHPVTGQFSPVARLDIISQASPWRSTPALLGYVTVAGALTLVSWHLYRRRQRHALAIYEQNMLNKERMAMALKGSDTHVWDLHLSEDCLYEARLRDELGYQQHPNPTTLEKHLTYVHPEDHPATRQHWQEFLEDKHQYFDCIYRMQHQSGHWLWFHDVGKIVERDSRGKAARIAGTYTNITATKANEQRAQLFGDAFSQIRDGVMILDHNKQVIATNQALEDTFDISGSQIQLHTLAKALGKKRIAFYSQVLAKLKPGDNWQGEDTLLTSFSRQQPILVSITAISGQDNSIEHYVMVVSDLTAQKRAEQKLRQMASYDALTQLPNRNLLLDRIRHAIDNAQRYGRKMALFSSTSTASSRSTIPSDTGSATCC